jgi:hypothetical protein
MRVCMDSGSTYVRHARVSTASTLCGAARSNGMRRDAGDAPSTRRRSGCTATALTDRNPASTCEIHEGPWPDNHA